MDVITMPTTPSLLHNLQAEYADITFEAGESFEWQPSGKTIIYDVTDPYFDGRLLHELSHALLNHHEYERDIDLIAMERDAWQQARIELGPKYGIKVEGESIHHDMNTYRDWLHERSTCPHCQSNGLQIKKHEYKCVTCKKTWRVNEARTCSLRRYKLEP